MSLEGRTTRTPFPRSKDKVTYDRVEGREKKTEQSSGDGDDKQHPLFAGLLREGERERWGVFLWGKGENVKDRESQTAGNAPAVD